VGTGTLELENVAVTESHRLRPFRINGMFIILAGWRALLYLERGSARLCRPFEGMMINIA
jgi:hypothetical protein